MATPSSPPTSATRCDPWAEIESPLSEALATALRGQGIAVPPAMVASQLDWSGGEHGAVALPVHRWAKAESRDPAALATAVAESLPAIPGIARAVAMGPFVNFTVDRSWLVRATLSRVFERGDRWGELEPSEATVCVEHTSANPTGPFHVGRVRNAIIGDTLARILRAAGSPVTTQYYVDDVGRQAAMVSWVWSRPIETWPEELRAALPDGKDDPAARADIRYGRPYPAVSRYLKAHPEAAAEVAEISRRLEAGERLPHHRELSEAILGGMVSSLARIGIQFDEFVWESSFLTNGDVERVVERLAHAPHAVREENGALALDTSSYGLPKETARVIVTRANGSTLYAVRDIAYHLSKFARFARVLDVLGQDHHLHAKTLDAMLAEIGEPRRPEFVIYQDITVPEGGRMSTRGGKVVYLDDLLDEAIDRARGEVTRRRPDAPEVEVATIARAVGSAAVRYHIARVAPEKTVGFRWEDALSFEGRSGPFLLYSYARATSLLKKAELPDGPPEYRAEAFESKDELALLTQISRFPATVRYTARTTHVHTMAGYAHQLAEVFNHFYETTPVLNGGAERSSRLALVAATRQTLGNALRLLGLEPLDRM